MFKIISAVCDILNLIKISGLVNLILKHFRKPGLRCKPQGIPTKWFLYKETDETLTNRAKKLKICVDIIVCGMWENLKCISIFPNFVGSFEKIFRQNLSINYSNECIVLLLPLWCIVLADPSLQIGWAESRYIYMILQ